MPPAAVAAHVIVLPTTDGKGTFAVNEVTDRGGSACVTATVWPAIVTVELRAEASEFAVAASVTAPAAVPGLPLVTVSQAALLTAVQEHPVPAVTAIEAVAAVDSSDNAVVESV